LLWHVASYHLKLAHCVRRGVRNSGATKDGQMSRCRHLVWAGLPPRGEII
jgi:hypothetical protein